MRLRILLFIGSAEISCDRLQVVGTTEISCDNSVLHVRRTASSLHAFPLKPFFSFCLSHALFAHCHSPPPHSFLCVCFIFCLFLKNNVQAKTTRLFPLAGELVALEKRFGGFVSDQDIEGADLSRVRGKVRRVVLPVLFVCLPVCFIYIYGEALKAIAQSLYIYIYVYM
jgi:hypothetical protein